MTDIPDDKSILTAAKQILRKYKDDVLDAKLHAARLSDEFLEILSELQGENRDLTPSSIGKAD